MLTKANPSLPTPAPARGLGFGGERATRYIAPVAPISGYPCATGRFRTRILTASGWFEAGDGITIW
jgi:hypothetical protein